MCTVEVVIEVSKLLISWLSRGMKILLSSATAGTIRELLAKKLISTL